MKVKLYKNFKKRKNSTLQPSGDFLEVDCTLKNGTSIVNPTIQLQLAFNSDYSNYNYCHIPDFGRFYYIRDLVWNNSIAEFVLVSDIMASFKSDIGAYNGLISRSSAAFNTYLVDNTLVTENKNPIISNITLEYSRSLAVRVYISSFDNGVQSFLMTPAEYKAFTIWAVNTIDGIFSNASQYITSAEIVDRNATIQGEHVSTIKIAAVEYTPASAVYFLPIENYNTVLHREIFRFTVPEHPQAATYGKFLNSPVFRKIRVESGITGSLDVPFYGTGDCVFTTHTASGSCSGFCSIRSVGKESPDITRAVYGAIPVNFAVQIPTIGAAISGGDAINAITSAITAIAGFAAAPATGGATIPAAVSGTASTLKSGIEMLAAAPSCAGGVGDPFSLSAFGSVNISYIPVTGLANSQKGRPFNAVGTVSNYAGFLMLENVNLSTNARADEKSEIETTMERGFYYE